MQPDGAVDVLIKLAIKLEQTDKKKPPAKAQHRRVTRKSARGVTRKITRKIAREVTRKIARGVTHGVARDDGLRACGHGCHRQFALD